MTKRVCRILMMNGPCGTNNDYSNATRRSFAAPLTFSRTPSAVCSNVHSHPLPGYNVATLVIAANRLPISTE